MCNKVKKKIDQKNLIKNFNYEALIFLYLNSNFVDFILFIEYI